MEENSYTQAIIVKNIVIFPGYFTCIVYIKKNTCLRTDTATQSGLGGIGNLVLDVS